MDQSPSDNVHHVSGQVAVRTYPKQGRAEEEKRLTTAWPYLVPVDADCTLQGELAHRDFQYPPGENLHPRHFLAWNSLPPAQPRGRFPQADYVANCPLVTRWRQLDTPQVSSCIAAVNVPVTKDGHRPTAPA